MWRKMLEVVVRMWRDCMKEAEQEPMLESI